MGRNVMQIGVLLMAIWIAMSPAQEMPVQLDLQYKLFMKILTFDRNLKLRVGDEIVFGIAYQSKFRMSLNVMERLMEIVDESSVKKLEDIPIRYVTIDLSKEDDLESAIARNNINILYVAPLRAFGIGVIKSISRTKLITTLTGVPEYAESGLAVSIGVKGQKPEIIINLPAATKEGSDFSSKLLNLARIIK